MTLLRTCLSRPSLLFGLAVLLLLPPVPGTLHAAEFKLLFSDKPNDPAPQPSLPLRPTVQQQFFVYVQNNTAADDQVTVAVLAGGSPVDGLIETVPVKAGKVSPVIFGKPPAAAQPAAPAPPGDKALAPKAQPPSLEEVKGSLQIRVLDKNQAVLDTVDLEVSRPSDYIKLKPMALTYDPKPGGGKKNRLTVTVKAEPTFAGPKCRIDLVLRADRVPGLIDSPRKEGTRGGYLTKAGGELKLTAENLEFAEGVEHKNGLVYLTIDGWERAYTFATTFPSDEGQPGKPTPVNAALVRLDAPAVANPGAPLPIGLEVDNAAGALVELGFDRDNDGKFQDANDEIMTFPGSRRVRMLVGGAGPGGCLLLQPEVKDWAAELDTTGVAGQRTLRVRVLRDGADLPFLDARRATLDVTPGAPVKQILQSVALDNSPPEHVKLVDFPEKLARGAELPVKATGFDPDSDIKEVVFYVGRPGPDGNAPPTAVKAPGKLIDKDKHIWAAALAAPTDQKGKMDVTAQFVNGANLSATDTVTIQLVDPTPPTGAGAGPKGGSVEGTVAEGGRGQPGLEVRLLDDKGAVKDAVKTDAAGKYLFKDVAAGSYNVAATKTTDSTKGESAVQVLDGQKKTGVDVKLTR